MKTIGSGGMGDVWLGEHVTLGRRAAIKVLKPRYSSDSETVRRFFNEAKAATAIAHPGIVQVFDYGESEDGSAYIVMELLEGETLAKRLASAGRLAVPDALNIARQVASALGAAHARGIVHRDLKPENIFLVPDPEVVGGERAKILDFGIAKLAAEEAGVQTQTAALMGTPLYMSPEQCRGAGKVDQRSDVYSLGCMLFALVVGRPPFVAAGAGELIAKHMAEPPSRAAAVAADIPPAVDDLIARCLEKDPERRFASGAELASALGRVLGRTTTPVPGQLGVAETLAVGAATTLSGSAGTFTPEQPPKRPRRYGIIAAGAGAVVVAGAAIAVIATRGGTSSQPIAPQPMAATPPPVAPPPRAAPPPAPAVVPASPPKAPDPMKISSERIATTLHAFGEWSRTHAGAPCPTAAELRAPMDGWDHAMAITCSDQPSNQIVGVISAGPDGAMNTADDIASWMLGRDITEPVRGPRWAASTHVSHKPAAKPVTKPPPPPQQPPPKKTPAIELDENGLPKTR